MPGITIHEQGVTQAARKLDAIGDAALSQGHTFERLARDAPGSIKGVPRDTGRLDRSLRDGASEQYKRVTPFGYEVGTKVPYARFVFGGTKHMKARPPRVTTNRASEAAARLIAADIIRAD